MEPKPTCDKMCEADCEHCELIYPPVQSLIGNPSLFPFNQGEAMPQQPYGSPQELPPIRIPEAAKHHITRSGR